MKASRIAWMLFLILHHGGCSREPAALISQDGAATNNSSFDPTNRLNVATPTNVQEGPVPNASPGTTAPDKVYGALGDSQAKLGDTNLWGDVAVETIDETRAKAENGDAQAQFILGGRYYYGTAVPQDYAEAAKWFRKAAVQGHLLGQFQLARCYEEGKGVAKDLVEASKWNQKWFENPDAAIMFREPADQGYAAAQFILAESYANGRGVVKDSAEAMKWYEKAAKQGVAIAQAKLGANYFKGEGVPRNYTKAVEWVRKAAEQGDPLGQAMLGECYAFGYGLPVNDIEAYKWLSLGVARLTEKNVREQVAREFAACTARMSRVEIAEAQRLAASFVPRKATQESELGTGFDTLVTSPTRPKATASGFFITADGFLVTNEHVVRDAMQIRLVTSAGLISAKVVKVDAANDLALLKGEGRFAALPVAASRGVKLGGTVATVGFPNIGLQGFAPKLAKGEIASLSGAGDDARYFQISVPVQPGNSGGALVDERGNVVGVVSAKLSARAALAASGSLPENVNYAVKSSYLLSFLESVPEVASKLKEPQTKEKKFEDVVKEAEQAAVLVLVY